MKKGLLCLFISISLLVIDLVGGAQTKSQKQQQPVLITLKVPIQQFNQTILALRNSTILDAQTANALADYYINQANDTTLNKLPKQK